KLGRTVPRGGSVLVVEELVAGEVLDHGTGTARIGAGGNRVPGSNRTVSWWRLTGPVVQNMMNVIWRSRPAPRKKKPASVSCARRRAPFASTATTAWALPT